MRVDDDLVDTDLVSVNEQSWRDEHERHSTTRHAIRPSLSKTPTPLESLGIRRLLHQVCARAKIRRLFISDFAPSHRYDMHASVPIGPVAGDLSVADQRTIDCLNNSSLQSQAYKIGGRRNAVMANQAAMPEAAVKAIHGWIVQNGTSRSMSKAAEKA